MKSKCGTFAPTALLLAMAWLAACGDDEPTGPAPPAVASVTVGPRNASLAAGESLQLSAMSWDSAGNLLTVATPGVSWSSDGPEVATVSDAGVVTAVAEGAVTITATTASHSGSGTVSVVSLGFQSLAVGAFHSCAITSAGAAYCWGSNTYGQIGDGTPTGTPRTTPVPVSGGLTFSAVSAAAGERFDVGGHTCGITAEGAGYCWGMNAFGQLGQGGLEGPESCTGDQACATVPQPIAGGLTLASVSAGAWHTCGLTTADAAYCWGFQLVGELGTGAAGNNPTPGAVTGDLTFARVSAGQYHTCGHTAAGAGYCWGLNHYGELGIGSTDDQSAPAAVVGGLVFTSLHAGPYHSCGITAEGAAYCWGDNGQGELGDGTTTQQPSPVPVAGDVVFASISLGSYHTCGVNDAGAAYCWGYNGRGELGTGTTISQLTPTAVTGGLTFATVGAGSEHACGITTAGTVYCWGNNEFGQLGNGTADNSSVPLRVLGQHP
jgi:alpha-tubulin suppressor-like RCC1 family protein